MAENIKLADYSIDVSAVIQDTQELKKAIDELSKAQSDARKDGKTSTETYIQNAAQLKSLGLEYSNNIKSLQELNSVRIKGNDATVDSIARQELLTSALNTEAVTIAQAREQNKLLNKLRNEANLTTAKGQEEVELLNKRLDENNKFIKDNVDALSQQKINVGNYADSIKGALGEMNPFNQSIFVFIENIQKSGGFLAFFEKGLKGITTGIISATRAALAFLATPIGAVIGAIGLALGLVVNALTSTQAGMDKVTAVTRPLTAIFQVLLGVIQDVGTFLIKAFTNPLDSLNKLYLFVKDKVVKQFEALTDVVVGLFTLDFEQLKNGVKALGDNAKETFNQIAGVGKQFTDRIAEGVRLGKELDQLTKEYEQSQIRNAELVPQLNAQLKEANLIARDTTKTTKEREESARKALELGTQINELKKEELKLEVAIKENEASRNDTSREEQLEIAKIKGQIADVDAQTAQEAVRLQSNLLTIQKEATAEQKKAVDQQISKQKELLDLFVAQQGLRAKTLQEELVIAEKIAEGNKKILEEELKAKKKSQEEYKAELIRIDEDLAFRRAEIAADNALREIQINRENLEKQREDKAFLSQELAEQRKKENNELLVAEKLLAEQKLRDGLINQQEFDDAIRLLTEENRIANKEIDDERKQLEKEEQAELRVLEFEQELERLMEEGATRFEIQQAQLEEQKRLELEKLQEQRDNALISEELFNARKKSITDRFNKIKTDSELTNEKLLAEQKINIAQAVFSTLGGLVDKNSAFGKALAIADAVMNTYKGVNKALAETTDPTPTQSLRFANAALVGLQGALSVKKIISTEVPKAGGGNISTSGASVDLQKLTPNQSNVSQVAASGNSAVQQQIEETAQASGLTDAVASAVAEGARQGTSEGSQQGLTNLSDNNNIRNLSTF